MTILEKEDGTPDVQRGVNPINAPGIGVFRIDYDLKKDGEITEWRACIGAYSAEEAQNYLRGLYDNPRIKSVGLESRLDAISEELRKTIIEGSKRRPGRPKKKE